MAENWGAWSKESEPREAGDTWSTLKAKNPDSPETQAPPGGLRHWIGHLMSYTGSGQQTHERDQFAAWIVRVGRSMSRVGRRGIPGARASERQGSKENPQ